jgi:hypothetical protein
MPVCILILSFIFSLFPVGSLHYRAVVGYDIHSLFWDPVLHKPIFAESILIRVLFVRLAHFREKFCGDVTGEL